MLMIRCRGLGSGGGSYSAGFEANWEATQGAALVEIRTEAAMAEVLVAEVPAGLVKASYK
jgi:hypothetical protein